MEILTIIRQKDVRDQLGDDLKKIYVVCVGCFSLLVLDVSSEKIKQAYIDFFSMDPAVDDMQAVRPKKLLKPAIPQLAIDFLLEALVNEEVVQPDQQVLLLFFMASQWRSQFNC